VAATAQKLDVVSRVMSVAVNPMHRLNILAIAVSLFDSKFLATYLTLSGRHPKTVVGVTVNEHLNTALNIARSFHTPL
jgi:hypothetical protein